MLVTLACRLVRWGTSAAETSRARRAPHLELIAGFGHRVHEIRPVQPGRHERSRRGRGALRLVPARTPRPGRLAWMLTRLGGARRARTAEL